MRLQSECIRYATNTQLAALFGISAKKFQTWTNSQPLPLDVAEAIATTCNMEVNELLAAWSLRKSDAASRKEIASKLKGAIAQQRFLLNERYRQLHIEEDYVC